MTIQDLKGAPDGYARGSHSPCIGVCILDPEFSTCQGCGRTAAELSDWATASRDAQTAAWNAMPNRLQRTSRNTDALQIRPWSPEGILQWASANKPLSTPGMWQIAGVTLAGSASTVATQQQSDALIVRAGEIAFRLRSHDKLRAFAYGPALTPTMTVLTLPKGRVSIDTNELPTWLGPDTDAIAPEHARLARLDLGVTRHGVRFSIRAANDTLSAVPTTTATECLSAVVAAPGPITLIVETQCARIEQPLTQSLSERILSGSTGASSDKVALPGWAAVMAVHTAASPDA